MATRFKSVIALLAAVMVVATAACAGDPPVPTPNIDATVEARVKQEVAAHPTATPVVVVKEIPPTDPTIPSTHAANGLNDANRAVSNTINRLLGRGGLLAHDPTEKR